MQPLSFFSKFIGKYEHENQIEKGEKLSAERIETMLKGSNSNIFLFVNRGFTRPIKK